MLSRQQKNQNDINLFLNNYFNVLMMASVILILAVSYFIFLKPKFDRTMMAIQNNIEQQQQLYVNQQRKFNNLKLISSLYAKIDPVDLERFSTVLPDAYVRERLYGELEEMVGESGFMLNSVRIASEDEEESLANSLTGEIKVEVSLSTIDYRGMKSMLQIFERNLRLFDIAEVDFSPSGNTVDLVLVTYYYKIK